MLIGIAEPSSPARSLARSLANYRPPRARKSFNFTPHAKGGKREETASEREANCDWREARSASLIAGVLSRSLARSLGVWLPCESGAIGAGLSELLSPPIGALYGGRIIVAIAPARPQRRRVRSILRRARHLAARAPNPIDADRQRRQRAICSPALARSLAHATHPLGRPPSEATWQRACQRGRSFISGRASGQADELRERGRGRCLLGLSWICCDDHHHQREERPR